MPNQTTNHGCQIKKHLPSEVCYIGGSIEHEVKSSTVVLKVYRERRTSNGKSACLVGNPFRPLPFSKHFEILR